MTGVYCVEFLFFLPFIGLGAMFRDGDRKRTPSLVHMGQIFCFQNKLRNRIRHTRIHAARIFADVARGKWCPKFVKFLMLVTRNSTRLCLLEFCLSIFVERCSNLSEVRQCRIEVCPASYITDQVVFRCFFYKSSALLHSKFHIC